MLYQNQAIRRLQMPFGEATAVAAVAAGCCRSVMEDLSAEDDGEYDAKDDSAHNADERRSHRILGQLTRVVNVSVLFRHHCVKNTRHNRP